MLMVDARHGEEQHILMATGNISFRIVGFSRKSFTFRKMWHVFLTSRWVCGLKFEFFIKRIPCGVGLFVGWVVAVTAAIVKHFYLL
jgi:hypothetical protein